MKLVRRVSDPPERTKKSRGGTRCPDIWETDSGDYVMIGEDVTDKIKSSLPEDTQFSNSERAVLIPKVVLDSARKRL